MDWNIVLRENLENECDHVETGDPSIHHARPLVHGSMHVISPPAVDLDLFILINDPHNLTRAVQKSINLAIQFQILYTRTDLFPRLISHIFH